MKEIQAHPETSASVSETHKDPQVLERKMVPRSAGWKALGKEESSCEIKTRLVKATRLAAEWVRAKRKVTQFQKWRRE